MPFPLPDNLKVPATPARRLRAALLLASVGGALMLGGVAHAQPQSVKTETKMFQATELASTRATAVAGVRLRVNTSNGEALFGLQDRRDVRAIELDLTQAQLRQSPSAWSALSRWVAGGGVVLLHTDVAQLFGFQTVAARERTRDRAGQLFGRARASLPFGANPLLWGGVSQTIEGSGRGALGVYLVYYQLQKEDQLVVSHGAGIPLLSVTDLSSAPGQTPLYAAMMAPFGNGWAIVLPRTIEARADGATFARNLDAFISDLPQANSNDDAWTSVSARAIEAAQNSNSRGGAVKWNELSPAFDQALQPLPPKQWPSDKLPAAGTYQRPIAATSPAATSPAAMSPEEDENEGTNAAKIEANAPTPERLLMRRSEAAMLSQLLARGDKQSGARELVEQLAARLLLQRGHAPGSQVPDVAPDPQWFNNLMALSSRERTRKAPTTELAPGEQPDEVQAQIQLWNGLFAATAANAFGTDARSRAAAWREALHWWNLALGQPLEPLQAETNFVVNPPDASGPAAPAFVPTPDKSDRWLGSVPTATVKQWQKLARWEFTMSMRQAPLTLRWLGTNGEQNAIEMFEVDAALPGIKTPIPGNEYPASSSFTWRLLQRTIQLIDSGVRDDLGWGADQVATRLTPEPWFYTDYGEGGFGSKGMAEESDVRSNNGCIYFWSSPVRMSDTQTGIQAPKQRRVYVERNPADPYDVVYTIKPLEKELQEELDEIAQSDARSKLTRDPKNVDMRLGLVRRGRVAFLAGLGFGLQESRAQVMPYYITRAHRTLAMQTLTQDGTAPPPWLQKGLENLACLSLANHAKKEGIYPVLPPELQHDHPPGISHGEWRRNMLHATASYEPRLDPRAIIAKTEDWVIYGRPLGKLTETQQVSFFYQQFGRGAVVETLQRLGAGQSIEEALRATTGLNQNEFMARWQQWQNSAPAEEKPPMPDETAEDEGAPAKP